MFDTFVLNLVLIFSLFSLVWIISVWKRDAGIIDPIWGLGFVVIAWVSFLNNETLSARCTVSVCLTSIWGLRLFGYLLVRNWFKDEDHRYRAMREKTGPTFWWRSYFTVFLLQAVIMLVISVPVQMVHVNGDVAWWWIDWLGIFLWTIGIFFEAVGDMQLAQFKSNAANRGKVLESGLWRWTRHPNYFGDFCIWWGFYLLAIGAGAPWTIFSPVLMSLFLMFVSGVTLLEKTITERRPEYADYIRRTNAFFPGPRKSDSASQ